MKIKDDKEERQHRYFYTSLLLSSSLRATSTLLGGKRVHQGLPLIVTMLNYKCVYKSSLKLS